MKKIQVINLDPIDRKKDLSLFNKLLITRYDFRGEKPQKTDPFGHYMFCGKQRSGKTASCLWFLERKIRLYKKRCIKYPVETYKGIFKKHKVITLKKFDKPPKQIIYSNFGVGKPFQKKDIFDLIDNFDPMENCVRYVLIDEFQTYYPKDGATKEDKLNLKKLTAVFSQLGKRNCFVFSTAQIYGRLDKTLREQCLYMVDCKIGFEGYFVNNFILESDIICDDLGRWSGVPTEIHRHKLSTITYDTKKLIRE